MAVTLALVEGGALFAAVCGTVLLWGHPALVDWLHVAGAMGQASVLSLCCITAFYFNDLYDLRVVRSFGEFAPRLVQSVGISIILTATLYAFFPKTGIAERRFVLSLLVIAGLVVVLRAVSYAVMRHQPFVERLLILGTSPLTNKLIEEIETQPYRPYAIIGVADEASATEERPDRYPLLGPLNHTDKIIEELRPDRIVIGLTERRGKLPVRQLLESRMRGIRIEDGLKLYERLTGKLAIESLTPSSLIFSEDFRKPRLDLALGRGGSLLVSMVGLITLAPILVLIAGAIKLDSRGPVFFIHERVGLHGRRFKLIKFRTMHPMNGKTSEWARDNSDRITRVGKWLRRFRLDELPQFVNILQGDMNLVGPRPHPVSNFELFAETIPYYSLRSSVRPGVTGWAQIRYGYANDLQEETEKMRYDLFYIKHLSIWLDIRILFETAKMVFFGREQPYRVASASSREERSRVWAVPPADVGAPIGPAVVRRLGGAGQDLIGLADHKNAGEAGRWTRAA